MPSRCLRGGNRIRFWTRGLARPMDFHRGRTDGRTDGQTDRRRQSSVPSSPAASCGFSLSPSLAGDAAGRPRGRCYLLLQPASWHRAGKLTRRCDVRIYTHRNTDALRSDVHWCVVMVVMRCAWYIERVSSVNIVT